MLIVRGVNVFPSAVREVVGALRARRSAARSSSGRGAEGVEAGPAAAGERGAAPRAPRPDAGLAEAIRDRLREVLVVQAEVELVPWRQPASAASTSRSSSSVSEEEIDAKAPEPGRPPHHDRRRRPADVDRLLGGRARDAVRLRAAQPRQRVREPPLLRPRRRPPDHDLHQRGPRGRPRAHADRPGLRPPPRLRGLAGDLQPGRRAARRARHPATAASRTAASWTRSTSRTRSGC